MYNLFKMNCDEEDYIIKDNDITVNTKTKEKYTYIMINKPHLTIKTKKSTINVNSSSIKKLFKMSDVNAEELVTFLYEIEPLNSTYNTTSTLESSTSNEENIIIDHSNDIVMNDSIIKNKNILHLTRFTYF